MKTFASFALALSGFIASVSAHGVIVSPPRRAPGAEMSAVCGQTIYNNQNSDNAGPVQLLLQSASSIVDIDACNLWLCKGYQFADNTAQVQTYSLGQTIDMQVNIIAPHTGYANVSIVDTKTNSVKGSFLRSWDVYASTATGVTADETSFSVTIPTDLTGCTTAGECVIQWYWYAPPGVDQTYEGCVDFVVGDGAPAATTSAAVTSATVVPTSTVVATTSDVVPTTSAVEVPTTTAVEVPTTTAIEVPTTSAVEVPTTTAVEVPTTSAVEIPTTTAIEIPTTTAAPTSTIKSTATTKPTKPTTTAIPTTLITRTRTSTSVSASTSAAAAPGGCSTTSAAYNKCLDDANLCMRNAQPKNGGPADFSVCDKAWAACKMC